MDIFRKASGLSEKLARQTFGAYCTSPFLLAFLLVTALTLGAPARSQEQPPPPGTIAAAARIARDRQANSTKHPKVVTNDDLRENYSQPSAPAAPPASSSTNTAEAPAPPSSSAACDNADSERLKADLQATQEQQDQLHQQLSYNPGAISPSDVDTQYFKPGGSGLNVGGPPLLESKPLVPGRIEEVTLEEKAASLKSALQIACDSPKDAQIQAQLDQANEQLTILQRQFDLDQNTYYSQTNFSADTAGKAKLDAEQQQIQDLQSEIDRLKAELPAPNANPSTT